MKILPCSSIPINSLINALVTFEESGNSFYIGSIGFSLDKHRVMVDLIDADSLVYQSSIPIDGLDHCSIQLNSEPFTSHRSN